MHRICSERDDGRKTILVVAAKNVLLSPITNDQLIILQEERKLNPHRVFFFV